jgi:hypothetical protein
MNAFIKLFLEMLRFNEKLHLNAAHNFIDAQNILTSNTNSLTARLMKRAYF